MTTSLLLFHSSLFFSLFFLSFFFYTSFLYFHLFAYLSFLTLFFFLHSQQADYLERKKNKTNKKNNRYTNQNTYQYIYSWKLLQIYYVSQNFRDKYWWDNNKSWFFLLITIYFLTCSREKSSKIVSEWKSRGISFSTFIEKELHPLILAEQLWIIILALCIQCNIYIEI